ncbi:MAG: glutamate--tRNA ligase, partial [Candidatus Bathyarchaeia archaeon]
NGTFSNYEDPKLATLMALRKRGIEPEAIVEMMIDVGVKPVDVTLNWETLYAYNRKIIDPNANRYFFVTDPIELEVDKIDKTYRVELTLHPDHPERGKRIFEITPVKGSVNLLVSKLDLKLFRHGSVIRLMGLFNIEVKQVKEKISAVYHSENYEDVRKIHAPIIHYLPVNSGFNGEIKMPDGSTITGLVENSCKALKINDIVQFERFGFVKINSILPKFTAYFAHK